MEGGAMTGGAMTGGALTGAGFFQDFARGFKKALGAIGSVASKVAPVLGAVPGLEELAPIAGAVGAVGKAVGGRKRVVKRRRKSKATGARAKRNALVRKIMRERGVSLPQASRIIKEEGLM